jgi:anthranilate synthase component 2
MLLLIDNYDSFTYNLVHYLGELGADVRVVRNDALSVQGALDLRPQAIVISPGPCDPASAGICVPLTRAAADADVPLLGVCLGHQTIGEAFGGHVIRCHEIVHGKMGAMHHVGGGMFRGLPSPFMATRYHSLIVQRETLPAALEVTAWLEDGTIMGLRHKTKLIEGVQFHPESIASQHGHQLLRNFLDSAAAGAREADSVVFVDACLALLANAGGPLRDVVKAAARAAFSPLQAKQASVVLPDSTRMADLPVSMLPA